MKELFGSVSLFLTTDKAPMNKIFPMQHRLAGPLASHCPSRESLLLVQLLIVLKEEILAL